MMIDAEKLLGKVLAGAIEGGSSRKKRKKRKSDDLMSSLVGGLTSGKGLITAIGLGVGAYEILSKKNSGGPAPHHPVSGTFQPPPLETSSTPAPSTPPPLPPQPAPAAGAREVNVPPPVKQQDLAVRLIQTMVAAAHADGIMDGEEEKKIIENLQQQGLNHEEKRFILTQLHSPKSIQELTQDLIDPTIAQTMYSLAVSTIVIDTEQERRWLDELAAHLSLSKTMQHFIEEEL